MNQYLSNRQLDGSFLQQYMDQDAQMIYRKFDNSQFNTIPLQNKRFFAGAFFNIKKLIQDMKGEGLTTQFVLLSYLDTLDEKNEKLKNFMAIKTIQQQRILTLTQGLSNADMVFDSNFESGNLFAVFKVTTRTNSTNRTNRTNRRNCRATR